MAMGAVLGISAWSRGQEKIAGVAATPNAPAAPMELSMSSNIASRVSSPSQSFASASIMPVNHYDAYIQPQTDYKGRKLVPDQEFPER
jgi:hypothetical protein